MWKCTWFHKYLCTLSPSLPWWLQQQEMPKLTLRFILFHIIIVCSSVCPYLLWRFILWKKRFTRIIYNINLWTMEATHQNTSYCNQKKIWKKPQFFTFQNLGRLQYSCTVQAAWSYKSDHTSSPAYASYAQICNALYAFKSFFWLSSGSGTGSRAGLEGGVRHPEKAASNMSGVTKCISTTQWVHFFFLQ